MSSVRIADALMSTLGDERLSVIVRCAPGMPAPLRSVTVMSSVPPLAPPAILVVMTTGARALLLT